MPDNFTTNPGTGGSTFAADEIAGVLWPRLKLAVGADGAAADVHGGNPLPVGVIGTVQVQGSRANDGSGTVAGNAHLSVGGSDGTNLRPILVDTSGRLAVNVNGTVPVSGPLTDAQLRAAAIPTVENATVVTGAAAQTAVVNNILEAASGANATDVSNFRAASVQITSTASGGTFIFEQSNDNVNFIALPVFNSALVTGVPITAAITATASAIIYTVLLRCRFLRLRIATTITGGSIQAFSRLSGEPWTTTAQPVVSSAAANLNATVSGTVTANAGTGTLAVSGPLTDTQIRASALPISGTVTANAGTGTFAVSLAANTPTLAAGTALAGDVGVQYRASATGAATLTNVLCPATPAAQQLRSGAGRLVGFVLTNTNAAARWVKVFNLLSASVTPGTTAATTEFGIGPNQTVECNWEGGAAFSTGITIMVAGGGGLTNNTAVTSGDVTGFTLHA